MSLKKLLSVLIFFIGVISYSQNLTCKDFKEGKFYIPNKENDSIKFNIIREGNTQIEINLSGKKTYTLIEWTDECTYKIKMDESKTELDESQQFVNDNGGLLVEKLKIEGKCLYYKSSLSIGGEEMRVDGKICKKEND